MRRQLIRFWKQLFVIAIIAVCSLQTPVEAATRHATVVKSMPTSSPNVVLGSSGQTVYAFAQIGDTMYAGGKFTSVLSPNRSTSYTRNNFVSFSASTGQVNEFAIDFNNTVQAIVAVPGEQALFIAGNFTYVDGIYAPYLIKYDIANDRIDPTFKPVLNGSVSDMQLNYFQQLIVAGTFNKQLLALNKVTGQDTRVINLKLTGKVNPNDAIRIRRFAVSPRGTKIVALGNFTAINGIARRQAFMLNMTATSAVVNKWDPPGYRKQCNDFVAAMYTRGVDFSPDGQYFVIVTTGGAHGNDRPLCDSAARFETYNQTNTVTPTWVNYTGGDSLYSVAITGAAVYVGGHQRWLDNPWGADYAGPGAVSRNGIGAIDPATGKALSWNPGKTRGHGTERLFATPTGLWVGSDGTYFNGYYRAGIAFVPL